MFNSIQECSRGWEANKILQDVYCFGFGFYLIVFPPLCSDPRVVQSNLIAIVSNPTNWGGRGKEGN